MAVWRFHVGNVKHRTRFSGRSGHARLRRRALAAVVLVTLSGVAPMDRASSEAQSWKPAVKRLIKAYPDFLDRIEGDELVWKDGTRMAIDDGTGPKDFEALLEHPDIKDMFALPYPSGRAGTPPGLNSDPGRIRYAPLFEKIYGRCADGAVAGQLVDVAWLSGPGAETLKATKINGVADKLAAVSRDLAALPSSFRRYLTPSAGTYVCRPIAGTDRTSTHGYGIAIDINVAASDYWRWAKPGRGGALPYKNRIPWEIVETFEKHGFIWGGKWYHYDTMHFEYRPELLGSSTH